MRFIIATGALVGMNFITPNPSVSMSFGAASWTAQFYFHVLPLFQDSEGTKTQGMFDFVGPQGTLRLKYRAHQAFSPSANTINLFFQFVSGSTVTSPDLAVAFGEWLLVTFEAHSVNSFYTLQVQDYGSVSLSD